MMPLKSIKVFRPICSYAKWPYTVCFYHSLYLHFMSSSSCFHAAVRMLFLAAVFTDLSSLLLFIICRGPENEIAKHVEIECNINMIKFWSSGCVSLWGIITSTLCAENTFFWWEGYTSWFLVVCKRPLNSETLP